MNISAPASPPFKRVRPQDAGWPSAESWNQLSMQVGGRLRKLESPFAACESDANSAACIEAIKEIKNPYYTGDQPALSQSSGYFKAWNAAPSAYVVEAISASDVAAAVNFARENNLRLVVKGGGHSYHGTSTCADSLLIWTRAMNDITLHDDFVASGCEGKQLPQPAVTVGAGAMWMQTYNAVTTVGGRYVQGGGCGTVGVAGLVQSGGFGSFSKHYGMAAAGLLEAEVVTADGKVRIVNACLAPDLFWSLKGGGGGTFGVITRLTLRTRELPEYFGAVFTTVKATSDAAFEKLVTWFVAFYREQLFNPNWGEQIVFRANNSIRVSMLCHGMSKEQAEDTWKGLRDLVASSPNDYSFEGPLMVITLPAQHLWDAAFMKKNFPQAIMADDRPGAPEGNIFWAANLEEAGSFWHSYKSAWLPSSLLKNENEGLLVNALIAASKKWEVSLHFNKGLAGAPPAETTAARDTATNPAVVDAFALAIIAAHGEPAYPGMPGSNYNTSVAAKEAKGVAAAMDELWKIAPRPGSYVSESDFFEENWQEAFWGSNYPRLAAVKEKYDPDGLFFVHHGVGSEQWSADGFEKLARK